MPTARSSTSEIAIFGRVFEPNRTTLSVAAAEAILAFGFAEADKARMGQLSAKAGEGTLTPEEQFEINNYEKVGHVLSLMKSMARVSLNKKGPAQGDDTAR